MATFLHGACFSLVKSTFLTALKKNYFTTWLGLTVKLVSRHLIPTTVTTLGHQKHDKHSLQSTKLLFFPNINEIKDRITKLKTEAPSNQGIKTTLEQDISQDAYPVSDAPNNKTNVVIYKMIELKPTKRGYIDLTGHFPYRLSQGNEYIIVGYNYDGNCILAEVIKNRKAKSITDAWTKINNKFHIAGIQLEVYLPDNEISKEFKAALKNKMSLFNLYHRTVTELILRNE